MSRTVTQITEMSLSILRATRRFALSPFHIYTSNAMPLYTTCVLNSTAKVHVDTHCHQVRPLSTFLADISETPVRADAEQIVKGLVSTDEQSGRPHPTVINF